MRLINRNLVLIAAMIVAVAITIYAGPVAQDPAYHQFADTRRLLGINNFWNVVSNLPFLMVGILGVWRLRSGRQVRIIDDLYPAYFIFFLGVALTAAGSAWYHLEPGNRSLYWDRLPMTLSFMGLFTVLIGEQVSPRLARWVLLPLLVTGAASIQYWSVTESIGAGDLRMYALVQFLPLILIPLMLILYESPFDRTGFFAGMIAVYVAAKLFEYYDFDVFDLGGIVSGHSLKHIIAAIAPLLFLVGIQQRKLSG